MELDSEYEKNRVVILYWQRMGFALQWRRAHDTSWADSKVSEWGENRDCVPRGNIYRIKEP